ncbi:hypothetical protein STCU_11512 [Strigomonas culicis]|uniref:Uncharacterized protein n=1 Tax=Strigomonas culicis TaxID=28005 RepID=S9UNC1_9TRYP|nr:hypothetical protein STCU_11512 [Strigomonas culicis]|eukprot:EPY16161.1 hypothetical protein STCU_11512 [Strigomonas culicis]
MNSNNKTEEKPVEGIQFSLDHIEELLNRGHEILYGDKNVISPNFNASPDDSSMEHVPATHHIALSGETPTVSPGSHLLNTSATPSSHQRRPSSKRRSTISAPRRDEIADLPVSARAKRISIIKSRGGRVPDMEEGVDPEDRAQDVSMAELKRRIHLELEEYRRNGPLMTRSKKPTSESRRRLRTHSMPKPAPRPVLTRPVHTEVPKARSVPAPAPRKRPQPQPLPVPRPVRTTAPRDGRVPVWERLYHEGTALHDRNGSPPPAAAAPHAARSSKVQRSAIPVQRSAAPVQRLVVPGHYLSRPRPALLPRGPRRRRHARAGGGLAPRVHDAASPRAARRQAHHVTAQGGSAEGPGA